MKKTGPSCMLIKNADVYAPEHLGEQDILIANGGIVSMGKNLSTASFDEDALQVLDCQGAVVAPGFIDAHVHVLGGGGGAGYGSRALELRPSEAFLAGTTTIIGCLGVDTVTRNVMQLVAKSRSSRERHLTVYCVDGGLDFPIHTLTGSLRQDMFLVPEIIGVGEPAISDKRSSQVTTEEIAKLAADVHVAGRLSGKRGFVQFHLGDQPSGMQPLFDILSAVDIKHVIPLHCNRNHQVLEESPAWAAKGGVIDITVPLFPPAYKLGTSVPDAIGYYKAQGVNMGQVTISSDGNGVSTLFGKDYIHRFPMSLLYNDVKLLVERGTDIAEAVSYVTANVADAYDLASKGRLEPGKDADLLVIDRAGFTLRHCVAGGHLVVENGQACPPPYGIDS